MNNWQTLRAVLEKGDFADLGEAYFTGQITDGMMDERPLSLRLLTQQAQERARDSVRLSWWEDDAVPAEYKRLLDATVEEPVKMVNLEYRTLLRQVEYNKSLDDGTLDRLISEIVERFLNQATLKNLGGLEYTDLKSYLTTGVDEQNRVTDWLDANGYPMDLFHRHLLRLLRGRGAP